MKRIRLILTAAILLLSPVLWALPQNGNGWTVTRINDAITYYEFSGMDDISGVAQRVFVIEWDTTNPAYELRYTWSGDGNVTSDIFRRENAVVALNAAYEPESTVLKVGGYLYSLMPNDCVMTTPVPNWKSEGALYTDRTGRKISIAFDGKGKSIQEQREFYAASSWDNIFTSAPMLIDDYEPVGAFFSDSTLTAEQIETYDYEDPVRHQGVRHPRTAVALTADKHFFMVAVDGRRAGLSEGMSARELTRFIQRHINPQYALNMDGGGSTTLCVRGLGEENTHVVNYPSKSKLLDHKGERRLFSHLCIVESPKEPRLNVREEVLADWTKSSGLDCVLDWGPKKSTPAPKGYEATYVSHYGRHGSRYAYTAKAYTVLLEQLRAAREADNLTEYGKWLLDRTEPFWEYAEYRVGDLTPKGWEQHRQIAKTMVTSFPKAFGKGSIVDACASASVRAIISMTSCVSSISREAPAAKVYAHQGKTDMQAARPNDRNNPLIYTGPKTVLPYGETSEEFFLRHFPEYDKVLARIFKDTSVCLGKYSAYDFFFNLYMFVGGMNSLEDDVRFDVSGIFTKEEYATLWETDNYERFREYMVYRTANSSIVDDIITKADARLKDGSRGADLRFGHDHVVMSLLMIMDIDDFNKYPSNPDDLVYVFQTFRSAMATNIQIVFYTSAKGEPLVKVLHNGEEARFGSLTPYSGPYYKWSELKSYLQNRINLFVDKK